MGTTQLGPCTRVGHKSLSGVEGASVVAWTLGDSGPGALVSPSVRRHSDANSASLMEQLDKGGGVQLREANSTGVGPQASGPALLFPGSGDLAKLPGSAPHFPFWPNGTVPLMLRRQA